LAKLLSSIVKIRKVPEIKLYISLATFVILFGGCGGTTKTSASDTASTPTKLNLSPIPDNSGLILQCINCTFMEDKDGRYVAGQIRNDAKQTVSGYALAIDLQDEKGKSIKKFAGLMLMNAMALQAGETKDFKERILSQEPGVTQAVVYFKKAGTEVKLSNALTLKLNAPPATTVNTPPAPTPTPAQAPVRSKPYVKRN
jgi:hypothetical protein